MSPQTVGKDALDKYDDDDLLSTLLRYGLFLGAIFQILCIGSSILLPGQNEVEEEGNEDIKQSDSMPNVRRLHKMRKMEKKKRR